MTPHLLADHADVLRRLAPVDFEGPQALASLVLEAATINRRAVQMVYAPFDHVNAQARVVIVGMTPGRVQAVNALQAAQRALQAGETVVRAAEQAKVFASFSGPMRGNLVRLLDHVGLARWLGISTTARLWDDRADLVHFTSALRYPVFVDGQNWSGQPDMVRTPLLRSWLERYTGSELGQLRDAVFVPLGPKVAAALDHLAAQGMINGDRVLAGLPHPSGANAERIAYFLGDKPAERCSIKTNPAALAQARAELIRQVDALS